MPLLKQLPSDKLAKIADVLEYVSMPHSCATFGHVHWRADIFLCLEPPHIFDGAWNQLIYLMMPGAKSYV